MFVGNACGTNLQAPTSGLVNFLPCFAAIRIGKRATAGARATGLCIASVGDNFFIRDLIAAGSSFAF